MARREKMKNVIAKNILSGTLSATAWAFELLINAGVLTIEAFLNPSVYADMPSVLYQRNFIKKKKAKFREMTIRQSLWRLKRAGFVAKKENRYFLTKKGKKLALFVRGRSDVITKQWDKKYRVVIFDIPEEKKKIRDWLRQELNMLNYRKLQESVFIGKYPLPQDLIESIKEYKIGNCVNYLLVEKVYKNVEQSF
ncbi:MAG: hypothetical protein NT136_04155 [Candidatus Moranbacteria bacterium]|nr:hypothetical protein [Candidatus Moranbacteria bacterium]